jgi:KRAB domain-containing zinc finger protein
MRKKKMEGNVTVGEDEVEKGKEGLTEVEVSHEANSVEEVNMVTVNENPEDPTITVKTTRRRRPSKKALESADQGKQIAMSRKPKKQAVLSNGIKCEEESDTGHATRQRSKSPRSTGSRSPRSSRSPRPAKEPVNRQVRKQKIPSDKEKSNTPKAKKAAPPKSRAKEINPTDGDKLKKRKRKTDPDNSQVSDGTIPEKIQKTSAKNNEAADGNVDLHKAVNTGKVDNSLVPMVPPKKRQRKKPETEGHILLNSKKSKKTTKSMPEITNTAESTDAKVNQLELGEQVQNSNENHSRLDVNDTKDEMQNRSEILDLNGHESKPETQKCALNGYDNASDLADPVVSKSEVKASYNVNETPNDSVHKASGISDVAVSAKFGNSEPDEVQIKVANISVSGEQPVSKNEGVICVESSVESSAAKLENGEIQPETTQIEKPAVGKAEVPAKKKRVKKKEAVDGEPVKEKKKRVKKVAGGEKVDGEVTEGVAVKPKKKRAKKTDEEKVGEAATAEGAPVKEKKKRVRKAGGVKGEGEGPEGAGVKEKKKRVKKGEGEGPEGAGVKEKKKRVKKTTEGKVEGGEGVQTDGKETVSKEGGGATEGVPVKVKKKRVYKKKAEKVEGEVTDGTPVKEKKKRVRKTAVAKVDSEANKIVEDKVEGVVTNGVTGEGTEKIVQRNDTAKVDKEGTEGEQKQEIKERELEGIGKSVEEGGKETEGFKKSEGEGKVVGEGTGGTPLVKKKVKRVKKGEGTKESPDVEKKGDGEKVEGEGSEKKKKKRKSEDGEGAKQPVMCEKCGYIAGSRTALKKHDVRCHNEDNEDFVKDNPFKCSICEYRAKKLSVIKRHVKKHGLEMCRFCEFVGENKILETHVISEHRKTIKCKKCQRLINTEEEDYEQHVEKCQGQHEYKCEHCDKEFKYKSTLKVHQITHDASLPKRFSCEHCDYQSHFKANLQKHIESKHSADRQRSIPCPVCEKLYYSEANMKKHLKNHTEERLHQCPNCDKSFKVADVLRDHLVTHSDDYPFKCEHENCDRTFKYRKLLKNHMLEFHKEMPKKLSCSHPGCGLEFFKKSHLRRHDTTHTGTVPQ